MIKTGNIYLLVFIIFPLFSFAQTGEKMRTEIFSNAVLSLQVRCGNPLNYNTFGKLNSKDTIDIRFDMQGHHSGNYCYSLIHCNADWTPSSILPFEYLEGFNENRIENSGYSINTQTAYTCYNIQIPGSSTALKLSGNYVCKVYDETNPEELLFTACFSIYESLMAIEGVIKKGNGAREKEYFQQIEFDLLPDPAFPIRNLSDLEIYVYQNNRMDNRIKTDHPAFVETGKLSYRENPVLLFEGGNEYRKLELLSHTQTGTGIKRTYLQEDKIRSNKAYSFEKDQNGRFLTGCTSCKYPERETDYYMVHFILPSAPLSGGTLHLSGDFLIPSPNTNSRMEYNPEKKQYEKKLLLKGGSYNYHYLFFPEGETRGSTIPVEGNFYDTENEYTIAVYYRSPGTNYDRLHAVSVLKNR